MRPSKLARFAPFCLAAAAALLSGPIGVLLGACGPFADVSDAAFCPFVLEIFYLGITTGTTATTYDPAASVTRLQMAAFLSRSVDGVLKRGSRRAALKQFWAPQTAASLALTTVGTTPVLVESDGSDLWVTNIVSGSVTRVHASDGRVLETWSGATTAAGVLVAMGRVFVTGLSNPGQLYRINPSQPPGGVTTVATNLGNSPLGTAFDGTRIWTANDALGGAGGSVSIVTPGATLPWTVTTVTTGFTSPYGALFDGTSIWVTDLSAGTLLKLSSSGAVLLTVTVGAQPQYPVFDGSNIWVPNSSAGSVSVVRASSGAVLTTLTGNGLTSPIQAAFDGQRVLVTSSTSNAISLWKAADLSPLESLSTGANTGPVGACSDGTSFWFVLQTPNQLARF